MKEAYVNGQRVNLDPQQIVGEGGEAEVYRISAATPTALKIWKPPSHPDFAGNDEQTRRNREGARVRIQELQRKIREFPRGLPPRIITPQEFATNRGGRQIVGYTMQLLDRVEALRSFGLLGFRKNAGVSNNEMLRVFRDLFATVAALHAQGVVIGDFNPLNVLVRDLEAYLIDADSMQFGQYRCKTFTARYVDPLVCDPGLTRLVQVAPHSDNTDWYAFAMMLFESMLLVHPYGGLYRPLRQAQGKPKVKLDERPLRRISVFNPEVVYPGKAVPYGHMPDELLHFYTELISKDVRGDFPQRLLDGLRWTKCTQCGAEHARNSCPQCAMRAPRQAVKETIRGAVRVTRIFVTSGTILRAAHDGRTLRYLYHENGEFKREGGARVLPGSLAADMRYRVSGERTVIAKGNQLVILADGEKPQQHHVDSFRGMAPAFDTNSNSIYRVSRGRLISEKRVGSRATGDKDMGAVLTGQTWFAVGPTFGFGFHRAGGIQTAFVFDAKSPGIKDSVKLPALTGQIVDATCSLSEHRCWFRVAANDGGEIIHRCYLVTRDGTIVDTFEAKEGDGSWLGALHGASAATLPGPKHNGGGNVHCLFVPTERGIVLVQEDTTGGPAQIVETRHYPDTRGFVDADDTLFFTKEGIYVVDRSDIRLITMSR